MARVVVSPATFTFVHFDAGEIATLVAEVADLLMFPDDEEIQADVDERSPLGRTTLISSDPVAFAVESGALEDARRLRRLSARNVREVAGMTILRALDRRGGFAGAPPDDALGLPERVAWDTWCAGRCDRVGIDVQRARRQYHFRNRHGFTDVADEVFERLWHATALDWDGVVAACGETTAARAAPTRGRAR